MSKASDVRVTPPDLFAAWHARFAFDLDVCATAENRQVPCHFGPGSPHALDAFACPSWSAMSRATWMNCPYSDIPRWLHRAVQEVRQATDPAYRIVCLLPTNTSARWFHRYLWRESRRTWRPLVREVSFHPTRLTFAPGREA